MTRATRIQTGPARLVTILNAGSGEEAWPVTVSRLRYQGQEAQELRLADDRDVAVLRMLRGQEAMTFASSAQLDLQGPLVIGMLGLMQLCSMAAWWLKHRIQWAGYRGIGMVVKMWAGGPLRHAPPGQTGEIVYNPRDNPETRRIREAAEHYVVHECDKPFGKSLRIVAELESGLNEPAGIIVAGPEQCCTMLTRDWILVTNQWPKQPAMQAEVACALIRTSYDEDSPALAHLGQGGVILDWTTAWIPIEAGAMLVT